MGKHALAGVSGFVKRGGEIFLFDPRLLISLDGFNLRNSYGDIFDHDLKSDIKQNGVIEPIEVQKNESNELTIFDGHRRHWACMELINEGVDIKSVPVTLIDKKMGESEKIFRMFSVNNSKPFNPFEEAEGCRRLKGFGFEPSEIAQRVGKSVPWVYDRLKLINASPETRKAVQDGSLGLSAATKAISSAGSDPDKQASEIKKSRSPKAKIQWDKQTKCLVSKGFTESQELVIDELIPTGFVDKLKSVGLDPKTLKITVSFIVGD